MQSTSKGDQLKWFHEGEWLKANKFGYEGLAEWASYELLSRSNIPKDLLVPYYLCNIHTGNEVLEGCFSKNFLKPGEELITLQRLLEASGLDLDDLYQGYSVESRVLSVLHFLQAETGLFGLVEYFQRLLALDAMILNEDRHTNNIAFIRDANKKYRVCPYFDHGLAFMSDTKMFKLENSTISNIAQVKAKPFDPDFLKQARALQVHNPLQFDKEIVVEFLEENKEVLGRIYEIMYIQMQRLPNMFV